MKRLLSILTAILLISASLPCTGLQDVVHADTNISGEYKIFGCNPNHEPIMPALFDDNTFVIDLSKGLVIEYSGQKLIRTYTISNSDSDYDYCIKAGAYTWWLHNITSDTIRSAFSQGTGTSTQQIWVKTNKISSIVKEAQNEILDIGNYLPFQDVKPSAWFYAAVSSAYANKILDGINSTTFSPNTDLTVAQAIKIAAVLHAKYNNNSISTNSGSSWYEPYVKYSEENDLLPSDFNSISNIALQKATRYEAAEMFYNVLKEEDKATLINNAFIEDISEIPECYYSSVIGMYQAGIISGMPDGTYDGNGKLTRAQVASIIMRILEPAERVAYDEKYNSMLEAQGGNKMLGGYAVYNDTDSYFILKVNDLGFLIIKKNHSTGKSNVIYKTNNNIQRLEITKDGFLYFIENTNWGVADKYKSHIMQMDLASGKVGTVCESSVGSVISQYSVYDGKIYYYISPFSTYDRYTLMGADLATGKEETVLEGLGLGTFEIYDNKVFCDEHINDGESYKHRLSSYDLRNGKKEVLLPDFNKWVLCGNTIFYSKEDKIYKYNIMSKGTLDDSAELMFDNKDDSYFIDVLTAYNGNVYFKRNSDLRVFKVEKNGSVSVAIDMQGKMEPNNFVFDYDGTMLITSSYYADNLKWAYIYTNGTLYDYYTYYVSYSDASLNAAQVSPLWSYNETPTTPSIDKVPAAPTIAAKSGTVKRSIFNWDYAGMSWKYGIDIDLAEYATYKNVKRSSHYLSNGIADYAYYVNLPDDDYELYKISSEFKGIGIEYGFSEKQLVEFIASFVQGIDYESDSFSAGYDEYPKFPLEYLFDQNGDCEDSSILLASLLRTLGFDCVMLHLPGHMAVGVSCNGANGAYFEYNGAKYYYIETTASGWRLGDLPSDFNNSTARVLTLR